MLLCFHIPWKKYDQTCHVFRIGLFLCEYDRPFFSTFNSFGCKMKGLKAVNILKIEKKKIIYHSKIK